MPSLWCWFIICQVVIIDCTRFRKYDWAQKNGIYGYKSGYKTDYNYNKTIQRNGLVYLRAKYARCSCGVPNSNQAYLKVFGGQDAGVMAYPWVSHLTHNDGFLICGGTLITDRHVMTAAHCLRDLSLNKFWVTVGDHNRTTPWEAPSIRLRAIRMLIHPNYDRSTFDSDIAILTLCRRVITYLIRPACLLTPLSDFSGHPAVVVGWGVTGIFSSLSDTLQRVEIQVVSRETCLRMPLEPYEKLTLTDSMICAGVPEGGKDACQGDSGGPLMWNYLGRWYVIGIVSKGFGCAEPGKFGIYTKVHNFISWIYYVTSDGLRCVN